MVAGEDDARHPADGYPAGRFQGLGGLVDEQGAELLAVEQPVGGAYEGAGDDAGAVHQFLVDAQLNLRGA